MVEACPGVDPGHRRAQRLKESGLVDDVFHQLFGQHHAQPVADHDALDGYPGSSGNRRFCCFADASERLQITGDQSPDAGQRLTVTEFEVRDAPVYPGLLPLRRTVMRFARSAERRCRLDFVAPRIALPLESHW